MTFIDQQIERWTKVCRQHPSNDFYQFILVGWWKLKREQKTSTIP